MSFQPHTLKEYANTKPHKTQNKGSWYTSPMMHAAEGCDIPYLSFDMDVSEKSADARGQMNSNELNKFRTTWCCKRYDHDAKLCRFAQMPMPMKI
jgi:hypothetical protein